VVTLTNPDGQLKIVCAPASVEMTSARIGEQSTKTVRKRTIRNIIERLAGKFSQA
jgi:hypothetical protein